MFGLLRLYELYIEFMLPQWKKQSWENKSRMHIQNLFQLIVTDHSAMHCYYSCGLPNCLTSKVSKLAQNWGSKWPWYAIIVIFLHYWRAIFLFSDQAGGLLGVWPTWENNASNEKCCSKLRLNKSQQGKNTYSHTQLCITSSFIIYYYHYF